MLSDAPTLGLKVHPYTFRADQLAEIPSFEEMVETLLIEANADGAFPDLPDLVIAFLKNKS